MARIAGYGGECYVAAAQVAGIREWSIDDGVAALESGGFDTGQDKAFIAGLNEWTGSFNGFKDGAPLAKGSIVAVSLREVDGTAATYWTGNIIIIGRSAGAAIDGVITYNYTFQGTGALTPPSA
jgi:hypothetical protein|tara:strand:- start:186 stop:557 length:372 start_codon:yes stop_codon:yes gene_type:complete